MTKILLEAKGASLTAKADNKITSGMVGVPVNIEYDSEWDGLTKTVIFRIGSFARVRKNVGTATTVPWEVLRIPGGVLSIGIEGRNEDGNIVIPTIWATVSRILPGANGEIPAAPNPDNESGEIPGGAVIDDSQTSLSTTWSSNKIGGLFDQVSESAQRDLENAMSEVKHDLDLKVETVNGQTPDENGNVEIETGGTAEGAVLYTEQELTPEQQAQARANLWAKAPSVNMFNLATAVKGYYLYPTNGAITAHADMYYTYIPITSAGSYIFRVPRQKIGAYNSTMIPLFDADNNFVRFVTVTPLEENTSEVGQLTQMTLSASDLVGVASFGFNVFKTQLAAAMVVAGTEYPESYIPYAEVMSIPELNINSETVAGLVANPLYKKVIAFTGDSICEGRENNGGGYAKIIGERNNMTVQNLGVSGGKITTGTTSFCISESVLNMREDADYVILEGGVNDMAMDNLGTISNNFTATLDTTTFCGAFEQMIKSAIARFPGKKIGYIAVHRLKQWAPDEYNTLHQNTGYYEAAISICKKWGIPVCNLTINCPSLYENDSLKQAYTTNADGWHPNEEGYKKYYVPKIEAWLKTL